MTFGSALLAHIAVGLVGLLLYWIALLAAKGRGLHRAGGRAFFVTLWLVAVSVGPLLLLRPGAFDPAAVVQFSYLSICLVTVSTLGWTAIRWKRDPERFRGPHFRVLGPVLFVLGGVVLAAGLSARDPFPVAMSWVGLAYGAAMIRFAWLRAEVHPTWWMNWHLNATCGLFTAVHGNLLLVLWRWIAVPEAGRGTAAAFQLGVLAVAIGMRLWFGARRGVPLRFSRRERRVQPGLTARTPEALGG
jgi:hypothetical protein